MDLLGSLRRLFRREYVYMLIVLGIGLFLRISIAPYSTGSDIPQFAGFADTFLRHGICFYKYVGAENWFSEKWPYPWPYVYGPMWALMLSPIRLFIGSPIEFGWRGSTYYVYAPMDWIVGVKAILIAFDTLSAILLYMILCRLKPGLWPLIGLALYYLNPMTIYISAIYGMFDQVALAFFLTSLLLLDKRPFLSGVFLSLTLLTKHTFLYPAIMLLIRMILWRRWRAFTHYLLGLLVTSIVLLAPFFIGCPGSHMVFIDTVLESSSPGYTYPIVYSFNGVSSLATYLHDEYGYDTVWVIKIWYIPAIILLIALVVKTIKHKIDPITLSAIAYIVYTATYWRVNHQYLVPTIALAIIMAVTTNNKVVKTLALTTTLTIALWPIIFPTSWWLHAHIKQPNYQLIELIDKLTLMVFEDKVYVIYSLTLTITQYILITTSIILKNIIPEKTTKNLYIIAKAKTKHKEINQ